MKRRLFVTGVVAASALALAAVVTESQLLAERVGPASLPPILPVGQVVSPAVPVIVASTYSGPTAPLPSPGKAIWQLPFRGNYMAWTVDDGADPAVVRAYAEMATETGTRLTFFANGKYPGWKSSADLLTPLVKSGQVVIANHTFSHVDLTKLSDAGIIDELRRNEDFIVETFGASPQPFYRPPFGFRDGRTDRVAASIGYSNPVLWLGSLSDSSIESPHKLIAFAAKWFLAQHIVIGHANFPAVTKVFPKLLALLAERKLTTVTLRDVFDMPKVHA